MSAPFRCWPPPGTKVLCWCGRTADIVPDRGNPGAPPHVICSGIRAHLVLVAHFNSHAGASWWPVRAPERMAREISLAWAERCERWEHQRRQAAPPPKGRSTR